MKGKNKYYSSHFKGHQNKTLSFSDSFSIPKISSATSSSTNSVLLLLHAFAKSKVCLLLFPIILLAVRVHNNISKK
jgi:hypothetical protein